MTNGNLSFHPRSSSLKPAVILIVMRKGLMCSSCILWPTLCSAICLCQLPLSPPTLRSLLKSTGSIDRDCRVQAFCHHTWREACTQLFWSSPVWLLSLAAGCGVTLQMAAGWASAMANLLPLHHGHAWGLAATSALTIGDGAEPAKHIHATGRQRHSAEQSSSSSLLSLSLAPPLFSPMVSY